MSASVETVVANGPNAAAQSAAGKKAGGGMSFGQFLSCLNPLQYVPVVGMIYRAVTGDTIPASVREVGSLVFSGLTSGPVGVGISLGVDAAERLVGFDEEKFGQSVLAAIGIGGGGGAAGKSAPASASPAATGTALAAAGVGSSAGGGSSAGAFSTAELAQFGLAKGADGTISGRGLSGADALNAAELGRVAATAYARAGALVAA